MLPLEEITTVRMIFWFAIMLLGALAVFSALAGLVVLVMLTALAVLYIIPGDRRSRCLICK